MAAMANAAMDVLRTWAEFSGPLSPSPVQSQLTPPPGCGLCSASATIKLPRSKPAGTSTAGTAGTGGTAGRRSGSRCYGSLWPSTGGRPGRVVVAAAAGRSRRAALTARGCRPSTLVRESQSSRGWGDAQRPLGQGEAQQRPLLHPVAHTRLLAPTARAALRRGPAGVYVDRGLAVTRAVKNSRRCQSPRSALLLRQHRPGLPARDPAVRPASAGISPRHLLASSHLSY